MQFPSSTPNWQGMYDLTLACAQTGNTRDFCRRLIDCAAGLIPFDKAVIYHLDINGKIIDQQLFNTEDYWSKLYMDRFSDVSGSVYAICRELFREQVGDAPKYFDLHLWDTVPDSRFLRESIRPRHLVSSLAFNFYDTSGFYRTMVSLDKSSRVPYTMQELATARYAAPLLNAMHRQLFTSEETVPVGLEGYGLTGREREIAELLCRGMSPARVREALVISDATVRKHLQHIYRKVGVSSQRELLAKLLGKQTE